MGAHQRKLIYSVAGSLSEIQVNYKTIKYKILTKNIILKILKSISLNITYSYILE